jgi:2-methylcitrate dehydratase PrpD
VTKASVTATIADYASSTSADTVPARVRERAKLVIFDELCCATFGRSQPAGALAARYAATQAGHPEARILGSRSYTSAPLAALVNGTSGHADEIDGAHVVGGHPGATLVHAAFALAEQQHAGGGELLNAVILGYDIGVRMIAACGGTFVVKNTHHLHADFLHAIGAAVAGARLLCLGADAYPHAMALATFQSNGLCVLFSEREHISKAFCNGQYASAGVTAALMAAAGLEGADDFFGGDHGLLDAWGAPDGARLATGGLGREYAIMQSNFKFVRAGYPIHAAVEAGLSVLEANGVRAGEIAAVEVGMPEHALRVVDNRQMHNICVQDMLAVALIHGGLDLSRSYFPDALTDERFARLRGRITVRVDPELQAEQPNGRGARVTITTADGRTYAQRVDHPRGHSARDGATWAELAQKWRQALPGHDIDAIAASARELEHISDVRAMSKLFGNRNEPTGQ